MDAKQIPITEFRNAEFGTVVAVYAIDGGKYSVVVRDEDTDDVAGTVICVSYRQAIVVARRLHEGKPA